MNRLLRLWRTGTIAWLGLALSAGCSGSGSKPKTVRVYGKVTYNGEPVATGSVMFQPVKPAPGLPVRPATGLLHADGSFEMSSFESEDGVVPGEYKVSIMSLISGPTPEQPNAPKVWGVPEKYTNPVKSGLTATVPADAKRALEMNFPLSD